MTRTLLMERVLDETRLAVIEDGALCELYVQRPDGENLTGNLYLGRVENVLPGMNAAFVDIGLDKNGFLAAGDIPRSGGDDAGVARIESLVRKDRPMLVQAVKSQPGAKGPKLSCHIALPGRLLALLPEEKYAGVSKKIEDPAERERLRGIASALTENGPGLILRTAAKGADEAAIRSEYEGLRALYAAIKAKAEHLMPPKLLHDDSGLSLKAVRELLGEDVDALWADGEALYEEVRALAGALSPEFADRLRLHYSDTPLFDLYRVDEQAEKALQKYVWLKSGGSLVIEETEALTVVDVNTGKNVGKGDQQDTIFRNNCEAATELMRQLRLRDIGGIVVVDFIDMAGRERREALLALLRELAARDRTRTEVVDITPLGLVEITRKRARQSLSRQLNHTCSHCGGNGAVPSHETTARRALRRLWRSRRGGNDAPMLIEACDAVCGWLRKLGPVGAGETWVRPAKDMEAGEFRLSPCGDAVPEGCKRLK